MGRHNIFPTKIFFYVRVQYRTRFGLENFAGNYSKIEDFPALSGCVDVRNHVRKSHI